MADPRFFTRSGPFKLGVLAPRIGAKLAAGADPERRVSDVALLEDAGNEDLVYCIDKRHRALLATSKAGACIVTEAELAAIAPSPGVALLTAADPRRAHAAAAALFYPPVRHRAGVHPSAVIDPSVRLGAEVTVGPNVVIGAHVEIGARTVIEANVVIGMGCAIGQDVTIGPSVSISHSLIGDRVVLHPGVRIGQDGFGFVMGAEGHLKVPQLGRVIVQDDVDIGANTTIDRGTSSDTVIGLGTKIDNLVQIGHNVKIGRGCVIAGLAGISGSTVLGDFVALGGQVGLADHVTVGSGARIGAQSGVMRDIPAGEVQLGSPAKPIKAFMREVAAVSRLAQKKGRKDD